MVIHFIINLRTLVNKTFTNGSTDLFKCPKDIDNFEHNSKFEIFILAGFAALKNTLALRNPYSEVHCMSANS